ncbi:MAG: hypothetical protein JWO66_133 [Candidatus Eremiobacteraeota bacterium]|nr:hypothetical protein [Candidatus Eremiobacteraeota bacterium]
MSDDRPSKSDELELRLALHGARLELAIANASDRAMRLWEWENSWGWRSLSFELDAGGAVHAKIERASRDWSKNAPVAFDIPARSERNVSIDLRDGWWEMRARSGSEPVVERLYDERVRVRAVLRIEPSPEAERQHVFTGTATSAWIQSEPPHEWLPRELARR